MSRFPPIIDRFVIALVRVPDVSIADPRDDFDTQASNSIQKQPRIYARDLFWRTVASWQLLRSSCGVSCIPAYIPDTRLPKVPSCSSRRSSLRFRFFDY